MKRNYSLIFGVVIIIVLAFLFLKKDPFPSETPITPNKQSGASEEVSVAVVIAEDLEMPWDIAFLPAQAGLPEGGMLVTERTGHVISIAKDGTKHEIPIEGVRRGGEGGLLGIVLHPQFAQNHLLYLYMSAPGTSSQTENRVVRYKYENNTLTEDKMIITGIPGALYHDGGRMEFGPDGLLYITTGDATKGALAQDKDSLAGKILRLREDGSIPSSNPFGTAVYSYGHRNPQGIAWDSRGRLWETEHGRSGVTSGLDEINLIQAGANYGWPESEGDTVREGTITPTRHSGANDTWAPASLVYLDGSLFFGGLRGEALYEAVLDGERVVELKEHFKGEYGRIRTVRIGLDGMLYLTTSNRDGRGSVHSGDDKIIRVNPELLE